MKKGSIPMSKIFDRLTFSDFYYQVPLDLQQALTYPDQLNFEGFD